MPATTEMTTTLNRKASRLTLATISFLVFGSVITALMLYLTHNQVKKHATLVQQRLTTQQSLSGTQSLAGYVRTNLASLQQILNVFPDESNIIEPIQALESLVQTYDPRGTAKFPSVTPVSVNNQLSIPISLKLTLSPYRSVEFLRQLERLPYIFEVTNYDARWSNDASSSAELDIKLVLYVQDPFRSEN